MKILIKNGLIVTMNSAFEVLNGDILTDGKMIARIGQDLNDPADEIFDAGGLVIIPGLVQAHVHLCQALFRNAADDLSLLDWLKKRIWPMEGKHTAQSLRISARLGLAEMIRAGTTTILDMGTVYHQDVIFEEMVRSGIRGYSGKAMMDDGDIPDSLRETTKESLYESQRLCSAWHGYDDQRINYAFAPRFALSCTEKLLRETAELARGNNTLYHSHASENKRETDLVKQRFGCGNIALFEKMNAVGKNLCLAHCIWVSGDEINLMREFEVNVLHCPTANLKLGSGIAPVPEYFEQGILTALGSDGAPCNNNMDIFREMRLAALIQKPKYGPESMPSRDVLAMATINGAKVLNLDQMTGSIECGKCADLTFIKNDQVHSIPYENIYSKLVYSAGSMDVEDVMINGKWVYKDRHLLYENERLLAEQAKNEIKRFYEN